MKRIIIRVQHDAKAGQWRVKVGPTVQGARYARQIDAIAHGRRVVASYVQSGLLCQLVLHGVNGQIRWERTYPRSSDPRRHRG